MMYRRAGLTQPRAQVVTTWDQAHKIPQSVPLWIQEYKLSDASLANDVQDVWISGDLNKPISPFPAATATLASCSGSICR
jgi:hypothetical protein